MPNPRGINQYSKGGGKGRSSGSSKSTRKPSIAKQASAHVDKLYSKGVTLAPGTTRGAHEAFVRQQLAAKAARAKKSKAAKKR